MRILEQPRPEHKHAFLRAYESLTSDKERSDWLYLGENADLNIPRQDFDGYVTTLRGTEFVPLVPSFVTGNVFWAFEKGNMVGRISLRHELNDFLREVGGHIGYIVHPEWRQRGLATWMLGEVLKMERVRSMGRVLLTCDASNVASEKTILKNGGVFEREVEIAPGKIKRHFWIQF